MGIPVTTPSPATKPSACTRLTPPTGAGQTRGTLAPGKLVDFAAYPTDPFTCPAEELARLLPVLTVVGGHSRHDPHGLALHSATLPTAAASS